MYVCMYIYICIYIYEIQYIVLSYIYSIIIILIWEKLGSVGPVVLALYEWSNGIEKWR